MNLVQRKKGRFQYYLFVILLAIEMIMSFTFLGYIHIPPVSATTTYIPVVVIACLFGPLESTVAGLCFGLGSMFKASASYVMPDDKLFSPFQSGFPVKSLLLSVGTRALFGLLIGLVFLCAKKGRLKGVWKSLAALFAPLLHALLVYTAMDLMFPETGVGYEAAARTSFSDIFLSVFCMLCVMLCDGIYHSRYAASYEQAINAPEGSQFWSGKLIATLCVISAFILCIAAFSTIYFSNRTKYMLTVHGVTVTAAIRQDILYLQVQFLASMLALDLILLLIILSLYRYMKYREYLGEMDALTNIMGRRLFLDYCARCQTRHGQHATGWFLFLDVDWFKQINDTLGHAAGDQTLREVARILKAAFKGLGAVGRVGGDEFAVIIDQELSKEQMEATLTKFLSDISGILPDRRVSCSIGACRFAFPQDVPELLSETDSVLYQAKAQGRARFVIRDGARKL